jgi:hypothetical protein
MNENRGLSSKAQRCTQCPIFFNTVQKLDGAFMPYPCRHFYFDIKFGKRLYPKEMRRDWPWI